jgi:hypothetical protein
VLSDTARAPRIQRFFPFAGVISAQKVLPRLYDAAVVVSLTIFHAVLGAKYRAAPIAYDERYFLNEGWSVFKGLVPYRDFQEFKPPVIFFVHALGLQLFGLEGMGYRNLLSLLSLAGFLALTAAMLTRGTHRLLVIGVVALMIDHFYDDALHNSVIDDAESLALDFFMLGCGVLLMRVKWERARWFVGGVLLALSPLSKEPMVLAVALAWVSLLLLHRIESGTAAAKRFAMASAAGAVAVGTTWLVYMLVTRSLGAYIEEVELSIAYTKNYAYQVRWAQRAPEGGELAEAWRRLCKGYFNAAHLAVFVPFFAALAMLSGRRWPVAIAALATGAASLYAVSVGAGFAARYFIMAMAGTFFCVVLGVIALDDQMRMTGRRLRAWMGITWLAVALATTGDRLGTEWKKYAGYQPAPPPVSEEDVAFVGAHSAPGDMIWTTDDPLLYVYSDRLCAFRGGIVLDEVIEYYPGRTDEERLAPIRAGLVKNRPKVVIFGDLQVGPYRKQRYMNALVFPFLSDGGYLPMGARYFVRPD